MLFRVASSHSIDVENIDTSVMGFRERRTVVKERGLAERTEVSPLSPTFTYPTINLAESSNYPTTSPLEKSSGQLPSWPTNMKQENEETKDKHLQSSVLDLYRVVFWFMETWA